MDVDDHIARGGYFAEQRKAANFLLESGGLAMGLAEAQMFVHLEVHLDEQPGVGVIGRQARGWPSPGAARPRE